MQWVCSHLADVHSCLKAEKKNGLLEKKTLVCFFSLLMLHITLKFIADAGKKKGDTTLPPQ